MVNPRSETDETLDNAATPRPQAEGGQPDGADDDRALLQKERDELKDQLLRSRAEFANYQRRAKQQAETDRVYAVGNLARDLLDPIDNLERAAQALRSTS